MRFCLVTMMALVLAACGGEAPDKAVAKKPSAGATMPTPGGDDAVAAVRESAGTPVAQLRFVIGTRPVAGKPFRLQLIASAAVAVPQLSVTIESAALRVDPPAVALALAESGSGAARQFSASHDFSVVGMQEGLVELTVRLATDADTPETVYVIPVLVSRTGAEAGTPASDKPDPAAKADNPKPQKG